MDRERRGGGSSARGRGRGSSSTTGAGGSSSSRDTLLAAVALQDHIARTMRIPGGPKALPSMEPGSGLTLAQQLGLVPRPPPLLTEAEWDDVHLKSRTRQDSTQECPICRELFKDDPQVLLSCSHVFHRACLSSYERYAHTRACPLCRSQQYQRRTINDGAEMYRTACAIRIQAAVRGWLARRQYKALRRHHAPSDPRLKRVWAAERLEEESDRLLDEMEEDREDIDALFAELDASLAQSRKVCEAVSGPVAQRVMRQLEQEVQRYPMQGEQAVQGGDVHRASGGAELEGPSRPESAAAAQLPHQQQASGSSSGAAAAGPRPPAPGAAAAAAAVDWPGVVARAKARGASDCPICIGALGRRGNKGVAWLSCTHMFHLDCIMAFEAFEISHGGVPSCPVCRAGYQRRCFE